MRTRWAKGFWPVTILQSASCRAADVAMELQFVAVADLDSPWAFNSTTQQYTNENKTATGEEAQGGTAPAGEEE